MSLGDLRRLEAVCIVSSSKRFKNYSVVLNHQTEVEVWLIINNLKGTAMIHEHLMYGVPR